MISGVAGSGALDPRVVRTRQLVLDATTELLIEHGFERVTIEAIADKTGIARSTIYRNWPDKIDLYIEAFDRLCAFEPIPDLGSLPEDLAFLAREMVAGFSVEGWSSVVPSLIGAAAHDESFAVAHRAFANNRRAMVSEVFRRAADRGEISNRFPPEVLAGTFAAGFFFQHFMVRLPIDEPFAALQVEIVLTLASG